MTITQDNEQNDGKGVGAKIKRMTEETTPVRLVAYDGGLYVCIMDSYNEARASKWLREYTNRRFVSARYAEISFGVGAEIKDLNR
jgi:hypothetical protein